MLSFYYYLLLLPLRLIAGTTSNLFSFDGRRVEATAAAPGWSLDRRGTLTLLEAMRGLKALQTEGRLAMLPLEEAADNQRQCRVARPSKSAGSARATCGCQGDAGEWTMTEMQHTGATHVVHR